MKKLALKIFVSILLLFVISEIALRICCHQKLRVRHFPEIFQPDSIVGYKYIPGTRDFKANPAFYNRHIHINSKGYNYPEFSVQKDSGCFRIIFVGSSDECGFESDGPNTYVSLMRDMFKNDGHKVEVLSCSVDGGYRDAEKLDLIKSEIKGYDADLILMSSSIPIRSNFSYRTCYKGFVINYHQEENLGAIKKYIDEKHLAFSLTKFLHKLFYSFRYLCKYYVETENEVTKKIEKTPLFKNKKFIKELVEGNLINGEKRKKHRFFNVDSTIEFYKEIKDTLNNYNSQLVFYERFTDNPIREKLFSDIGIKYLGVNVQYNIDCTFGKINGHSTQIGHGVTATKFYAKLLSSNVIPSKFLNSNIKESRESNNIISPKKTPFNKPKIGNDYDSVCNALILHGNIPDIQKYLRKNISNSKLKADAKFLNVKELKTFDEVIELTNRCLKGKFYNMVFIPLPQLFFSDNYEKNSLLFSDYNNYLKSKNIKVTFYFLCNNTNVSDPKNCEKRIIKYLLKKDSIECNQIRIQESEIKLRKLTKEMYSKIVGVSYADYFMRKIQSFKGETNSILHKHSLLPENGIQTSSEISNSLYKKTKLIDTHKNILADWATGWVSSFKNAQNNHKEWIRFNFHNTQTINRLILYPISKLDIQSNGFPVDFEIQHSNDGVHWDTHKKYNNLKKPGLLDEQVYDFPPVTTKFFRIYASKLRKDSYPEGNFFKLGFSEIELYGKTQER